MSQADAGLSAMLGVEIRLAWAADALPPTALTDGEARQYRSRGDGPARQDWLRGRAALRALLPDGQDTADLAFPHRSLSLSHAGGVAVAARCGHASVAGIGVDFEPDRADADPRVARFFLRCAEQAAATDASALLRLWTIKEALFKATPDNRSCVLLDFELADPTRASGGASGPRGELLRYAAVDVPAGHLAVAVCIVRQHAAV